jgi:hypothetical protein
MGLVKPLWKLCY